MNRSGKSTDPYINVNECEKCISTSAEIVTSFMFGLKTIFKKEKKNIRQFVDVFAKSQLKSVLLFFYRHKYNEKV